jgi:hypothetical protein
LVVGSIFGKDFYLFNYHVLIMCSACKILTMVVTILLLSCLIVLIVYPVSVYAVSKPSVPQFSVKFIDKSYDVPPTQTTDHYTGETITQPGYHVNDGLLEVTITNQPFKPYTVGGYQQRDLYYTVEVKGHFGGDSDWRAIAHTDSVYQREISYIEQSGSKYTVLTDYSAMYDSGVQLDFRVKAVIGYLQVIPPFLMIIEESGDWSSIQTITINHGTSPKLSQTVNASNSPTSDPYNPPQLNLMIVVVSVCVIAVLLAVIVYQYRQSKTAILSTANP